MKIFILSALVVAAVAEPPVTRNDRYLPPEQEFYSSGSGYPNSPLYPQYGGVFQSHRSINDGRYNNGAGAPGPGRFGADSRFNGGVYSPIGQGTIRNDNSWTRPGYRPPRFDDGYRYPPADYGFEYQVIAPEYGNFYGHKERRLGDQVEGVYYVQLPDGSTQTVMYTADENGYHPTIYKDVGVGVPTNYYPGLNQGGFNKGGLSQGGYDQGSFNQGGFNQDGFNQGGFNKGGFNHGGLWDRPRQRN